RYRGSGDFANNGRPAFTRVPASEINATRNEQNDSDDSHHEVLEINHSSQNLSLRYLSALSGKTVTTTAGPRNSRATISQPTSAAPAEIPTSKPSLRASRFTAS